MGGIGRGVLQVVSDLGTTARVEGAMTSNHGSAPFLSCRFTADGRPARGLKSYLRLSLLAQPKPNMTREEREQWLQEFYEALEEEVKRGFR